MNSVFSSLVKEQPVARRLRRDHVKLQRANPFWQQPEIPSVYLETKEETGSWMSYRFLEQEDAKAFYEPESRQVELWVSGSSVIADKDPKLDSFSPAQLIFPSNTRSKTSRRGAQVTSVLSWQAALEKRLATLKEAAQEEGVIYSAVSEVQMRAFLANGVSYKMPAIFVLGNGNLRAVWENSSGEQVGLQFQGEDEVQFVLFGRRRRDRLSHSAGRDTLEGVMELIRAMRLLHLVTA